MIREIIRDKRAEDITIIWWFIMFVLVAFFLVAGVFIVRSKEIDSRGLEAQILSLKIYDCLVDNGKLTGKLDRLASQDLVLLRKECGIIIDSEYYIKIISPSGEIIYGDEGGGVYCELQQESKRKKFAGIQIGESHEKLPQCFRYKLNDIEIISGVYKTEQNVKT
ncbi:MAG: hypothetical protein ABIH72_01215 [archaeon]